MATKMAKFFQVIAALLFAGIVSYTVWGLVFSMNLETTLDLILPKPLMAVTIAGINFALAFVVAMNTMDRLNPPAKPNNEFHA